MSQSFRGDEAKVEKSRKWSVEGAESVEGVEGAEGAEGVAGVEGVVQAMI